MTRLALSEVVILAGLAGIGWGAYLHVDLGFAIMCVSGIITAVGFFGFFTNLRGKDTDADGS